MWIRDEELTAKFEACETWLDLAKFLNSLDFTTEVGNSMDPKQKSFWIFACCNFGMPKTYEMTGLIGSDEKGWTFQRTEQFTGRVKTGKILDEKEFEESFKRDSVYRFRA